MKHELSCGFVLAFTAACGVPRSAAEVGERVHLSQTVDTSDETASSDHESRETTVPPEPSFDGPGARLFGALRALENGESRKVRVTWLGDSHTAADFWTGEARRKLQARFGDAGPGFIPLSLGGRRHEVASVKVKGVWRQEPKSGASRSRQLDGQFGLAGRRIRGFPGASFDVKSGVKGRSRWSVLYRQEPSQSKAPRLEFRDGKALLTHDEEQRPSFAIATFEREADPGPVSVQVRRGQYVVWGVVVESDQSGIVLDALGINGARLRTLLAWDGSAWQSQLQWREPDLVVLAYGTNETGDGGDMGRYADDYRLVVRYIQDLGADCMLVGPTDRQDDSGHTLPEVEALDAHLRQWSGELGCLYYSPFAAMGGSGGYAHWRKHKPQLASKDGVHLTISGYRYLAEDWVAWFLAQYDEYLSSTP